MAWVAVQVAVGGWVRRCGRGPHWVPPASPPRPGGAGHPQAALTPSRLCSYVSAMVPVKSPREYYVQQEVIVLFCETVER